MCLWRPMEVWKWRVYKSGPIVWLFIRLYWWIRYKMRLFFKIKTKWQYLFSICFSDEQNRYCDSPVEVRLAEGNNVTMGRVEVRYKGLIFNLIKTYQGLPWSNFQSLLKMFGEQFVMITLDHWKDKWFAKCLDLNQVLL